MPSGQDVNLKEVDVLREFSGKFGDFLEIMTMDLNRVLESLLRIQEEVNQKAKNASEQHEEARADAKKARNEWQNLMSQSTRDPKEVTQCRQRLDHAEGHVQPLMRNYSDLSQTYASHAKRDIDQMMDLTSKYRNKLITMVENGRKFLALAEDQVRNYKETNVGGQQS